MDKGQNQSFVDLHLQWIYDDIVSFPRNKLSQDGLSEKGYHIGVQSVEVQFVLWQCLHNIVKERGIPFPKFSYIAPTSVSWWNANKGYIDITSRYLSHIKVPFKGADPILQIAVRFCSYELLNGYLTTRYENLDMNVFQDPSSTFGHVKKRFISISCCAKQSIMKCY